MRWLVIAAVTGLGTLGVPALAHADETVVVPGSRFPTGSSTYLSYFGCTDLYHADTPGPRVRVARDDTAPTGRRATSLAMPGTGAASGPVSLVDSVASATSTVSVTSTTGGQGVAYVWFVSEELDDGEVWAGRADLSIDSVGWQQVDTMALTYDWTRLDAASGEVLDEPGEAAVDDFTAEHGDGPGYLLAGFGCDGQEFLVDRIGVGGPGTVTTYDLEGWSVTTSIAASEQQVAPGGSVQVTGTSTDPWERVMRTPMVLEARPDGAAGFEPVSDAVAAGEDGSVVATVTPEVTTDYRWVFPETAYADAHHSEPVRVTVAPAAAEPSAPEEPEVAVPSSPSPPAMSGSRRNGEQRSTDGTRSRGQRPDSERQPVEDGTPADAVPTDPVPELPTPDQPAEDATPTP